MKQGKVTILRIIVVLISLGLAVSAGRTIVDLWARRDILRVREAELAKLTQQNEELTRKLSETQSEEYVERVARDKLGFVKVGEAIVIVPEATQGAMTLESSFPNWKRWLKLFF